MFVKWNWVTLEWVAMSFSNAWKWKVKVKSLSRVRLVATSWTAAYQAPPSMGFSRREYWSGVPLPSPCNLLLTYKLWQRAVIFRLCYIIKDPILLAYDSRVSLSLSLAPCEEASYHDSTIAKKLVLSIIWAKLEKYPSPIKYPDDSLPLANTLIVAL